MSGMLLVEEVGTNLFGNLAGSRFEIRAFVLHCQISVSEDAQRLLDFLAGNYLVWCWPSLAWASIFSS